MLPRRRALLSKVNRGLNNRVPRVPLKGSLKGFYKGSIRVLYYSESQKVGTWV